MKCHIRDFASGRLFQVCISFVAMLKLIRPHFRRINGVYTPSWAVKLKVEPSPNAKKVVRIRDKIFIGLVWVLDIARKFLFGCDD